MASQCHAFALASGSASLRESPTAPTEPALRGQPLAFGGIIGPAGLRCSLETVESRSARAGADPSETHEAVVLRPAQTSSDVLETVVPRPCNASWVWCPRDSCVAPWASWCWRCCWSSSCRSRWHRHPWLCSSHTRCFAAIARRSLAPWARTWMPSSLRLVLNVWPIKSKNAGGGLEGGCGQLGPEDPCTLPAMRNLEHC